VGFKYFKKGINNYHNGHKQSLQRQAGAQLAILVMVKRKPNKRRQNVACTYGGSTYIL